MKKLLLTATLVVGCIGTLSAIDTNLEENTKAEEATCQQWVTINTWCGSSVYTCGDNLSSRELIDRINYVNKVRCGSETNPQHQNQIGLIKL